MAPEDSEFQTELRGYKRSEVDEVINALRGELITASKDLHNALEELKVAREQLATVESVTGETNAPTYAGLGSRLEAVLRIAEEQSSRLIGQADIDAERIIAHAKAEAAEIIATAKREAERIDQDSTNQASNQIALAQQKITGELLGDTAVKLGFVSSKELGQALAEQAGMDYLDLSQYPVSEEALKIILFTLFPDFLSSTKFTSKDFKKG